jgi:hypothetical protein
MKKITLPAIIAIIGFIGCSKNYSSPNSDYSSVYYVKATINGTDVDFHYTGASFQNPATLNVFGNSSNASSSDGINILFQLLQDNNNTQVGAGVYTDTANVLDPEDRPDSPNVYSYYYFNTNEANITVQQSGIQ